MIYNVFGSASSRDYDVLVFTNAIPAVQACHERCTALAAMLTDTLPGKKVSVNLAVCDDGVLISVFKGLTDECNNALWHTYALHPQTHPLVIQRTLPRSLEAKVHRSLRVTLSYLSRSVYREPVKAALRGDDADKRKALAAIDLTSLGGETTELFKSLAFQFGQCVALAEGIELYTKEALLSYAPELTDYLNRVPRSGEPLERYKQRFLALTAS